MPGTSPGRRKGQPAQRGIDADPATTGRDVRPSEPLVQLIGSDVMRKRLLIGFCSAVLILGFGAALKLTESFSDGPIHIACTSSGSSSYCGGGG